MRFRHQPSTQKATYLISFMIRKYGLHVLFYYLLKYTYLHRPDGGHNVKTVKGGVKKVFLFTSLERVLVALSFSVHDTW